MGTPDSCPEDTTWELRKNWAALLGVLEPSPGESLRKQWGHSTGGWGDTGIPLREGTGKAQGSWPRNTRASHWGP